MHGSWEIGISGFGGGFYIVLFRTEGERRKLKANHELMCALVGIVGKSIEMLQYTYRLKWVTKGFCSFLYSVLAETGSNLPMKDGLQSS